MKSPRFDYVKPDSLPEVFELLARHGEEARILAGGQTLMATLNMRLSEPAVLIDISGLSELGGITLQGSTEEGGAAVDSGGEGGTLRIGALVTHTEIEQSQLIARHAPLISAAAPHIGHRAIRNLGTFGGSIAYADPAAEWPACALALEGSIVLAGVRDRASQTSGWRSSLSRTVPSGRAALKEFLPVRRSTRTQWPLPWIASGRRST